MASRKSPENRVHLKRLGQPPAHVLAAAPVKVGDRVQAFAQLLDKKQLLAGSISTMEPSTTSLTWTLTVSTSPVRAMVGRNALTVSLSRGRKQ